MADMDNYPKYVEPHESHIVFQGDHGSAPAFEPWCLHHDRVSQKYFVLVMDEDEEKRATSPREAQQKDD